MNNIQLYQAELLEHYQHPKNYGVISCPDITTGNINPSCGDAVSFTIKVTNFIINDIQFQGKGCVISMATASLFTEFVKHKSMDYILKLTAQDMLNIIKIPLGPTRIRCALLSLEALQSGIQNYKHQ
jgi:nitrogen fixation protein NifU and related proteins